MIQEGKKLFFQTINIFLEDDKIEAAIASRRFAYINIISHNRLSLPHFYLREKQTAVINLLLSPEEIFKRFNDTTKNEIRQTQKRDDFQVLVDGNDFLSVYELYQNFEKAQGRQPFPAAVVRGCHTFSLYHQGKILAGIFVDEAKPYLRLRYIFSQRVLADDHEVRRLTGKATRRLVWEICLWGKSHGFALLDLATVNFNNPKTASIAKFKMSFGGEIIPEYTYIFKSPLFSFLERFYFLRSYWIKIKAAINSF